jgi:hypothetical protein
MDESPSTLTPERSLDIVPALEIYLFWEHLLREVDFNRLQSRISIMPLLIEEDRATHTVDLLMSHTSLRYERDALSARN